MNPSNFDCNIHFFASRGGCLDSTDTLLLPLSYRFCVIDVLSKRLLLLHCPHSSFLPKLIMRTQDTQLGEVAATIGTLKTMGAAIGDELEDQNRYNCWRRKNPQEKNHAPSNFSRHLFKNASILTSTPQLLSKILQVTRRNRP